MTASQEFRDGVATGALTVAVRLRTIEQLGLTITPAIALRVAETVAEEYGGARPLAIDGEALS